MSPAGPSELSEEQAQVPRYPGTQGRESALLDRGHAGFVVARPSALRLHLISLRRMLLLPGDLEVLVVSDSELFLFC